MRPSLEIPLEQADWSLQLVPSPSRLSYLYEYRGMLPGKQGHYFSISCENLEGRQTSVVRPNELVSHKFVGICLKPQSFSSAQVGRLAGPAGFEKIYLLPTSWAEKLTEKEAVVVVDQFALWWINAMKRYKRLDALKGEAFYLNAIPVYG